MSAQLINGNGFEGCTAQVDADFYEGIFGKETCILAVGRKMDAAIVNNSPRIYDGVILTKEGRRIQIDYGTYQDFTVPAGTAGQTAYYIIGFKLSTNSDDTQTCEPFVRAVDNPSATITENMLKDGNAEVYISVYRVTQTGTTNALGEKLLNDIDTLYGKKVYKSLADIGINTSTAYYTEIYAAMQDGTIAIIPSESIAELPYTNASGIAVFFRSNVNRGKVLFLSEGQKPNYQISKNASGIWEGGWEACASAYHYGETQRWRFSGAGFITGGGAAVVFSIPVNQSLENISTITPIQMDIKVRQDGNYLAGTAVDFETVDSVTLTRANNCVLATARMNNGYGGTNNDVCGIEGYCTAILT